MELNQPSAASASHVSSHWASSQVKRQDPLCPFPKPESPRGNRQPRIRAVTETPRDSVWESPTSELASGSHLVPLHRRLSMTLCGAV